MIGAIGRTGLVQSGDGRGGTARVEVTGAGASLQTPGTLVIARGEGGGSFTAPSLETFLSQNAGNGRGGSATLSIDADATAAISAGSVGVVAWDFGGNAGGENSTGGDGQGGSASVTGAGGATIQFDDLTGAANGCRRHCHLAQRPDRIGGRRDRRQHQSHGDGRNDARGRHESDLIAGAVSPTTDNIGSANGGTVTVLATNNSNINVNSQFIVDAFAGSTGLASPARSAARQHRWKCRPDGRWRQRDLRRQLSGQRGRPGRRRVGHKRRGAGRHHQPHRVDQWTDSGDRHRQPVI